MSHKDNPQTHLVSIFIRQIVVKKRIHNVIDGKIIDKKKLS